MRKTLLVTAFAAAALPSAANAELTGNMGIFSDYRFRGISQTFLKPAFQGGIDYSHSSGFYVGNWNSNVSGLVYTDGSLEMDFYGGYKFGAGPVGLDVGVLQYYYPGAKNAGVKYDTTEVYIGASWKWFTAKYSLTTSDYFGLANSDGSGYLDLGCWPFQIPLGALIPVRVENLLPGGKNLGVTHITNGAFRLHPVEWNVGEAAGILAAFCLDRKVPPRAVRRRPELTEAYQALLRREGVELSWPGPLKPL